MRLPKRLSDAVHFAAWCQREQQAPANVARLLVLAGKAKRLGEHYCNTGERDRKVFDYRESERMMCSP